MANKKKMPKPKSLDQAITDKALRLYDEIGPEKQRKAMKKDFQNYKRKKGYEHIADPLHPKNAEGMGVGRKYGGSVVKKKKGGKLGNCLY